MAASLQPSGPMTPDVLQVVNVLPCSHCFSSEENEVCGQMALPLLVHSSGVFGGARSSRHLLDTSESQVCHFCDWSEEKSGICHAG